MMHTARCSGLIIRSFVQEINKTNRRRAHAAASAAALLSSKAVFALQCLRYSLLYHSGYHYCTVTSVFTVCSSACSRQVCGAHQASILLSIQRSAVLLYARSVVLPYARSVVLRALALPAKARVSRSQVTAHEAACDERAREKKEKEKKEKKL